MLAELSNLLLILSMVAALRLSFGITGRYSFTMFAGIHAGCLLASYIGLTMLFLLDDFTVGYVVKNSNSLLPWWYKVSAVWGAHEGSILLWLLILSGWIFFAVSSSAQFNHPWRRYMVISFALISAGLSSFVIFTSNPFLREYFPFQQGNDLNPLLQDPGLIFHPPLLYLGYIGMVVPYGAVMGMLISDRKATKTELTWIRKWVLTSFAFLSLGIALGSFWAYYELGWGGWWFWDPVENASLMPWLIAIALIHSLAVAIKRGKMLQWVYLLALLGFAFSVLGTFLVRSGIIISVHSFASDPSRGIYILMLLAALTIPAMFFFTYRKVSADADEPSHWFSREGLIKINNCIFISLLFVVALGTLYPLVLEILRITKISVGPPFYNTVFIPIALPLYLIMTMAPITRWEKDSFKRVAKQYTLSAVCALATLIIFYASTLHLYFSFISAIIMLVLIHTISTIYKRKVATGNGVVVFLKTQSLRWYGMNIAHLGGVVFLIGALSVSWWQEQSEEWMKIDEVRQIASYTITLEQIQQINNDMYTGERAILSLRDSKDRKLKTMSTEKRLYSIRNQPTTEAAIYAGWSGDVFIALGEVSPDNSSAQVRIQHKPMIRWIWLGFFLIALGAFVSYWQRDKK